MTTARIVAPSMEGSTSLLTTKGGGNAGECVVPRATRAVYATIKEALDGMEVETPFSKKHISDLLSHYLSV